jgi:hypothetical protein
MATRAGRRGAASVGDGERLATAVWWRPLALAARRTLVAPARLVRRRLGRPRVVVGERATCCAANSCGKNILGQSWPPAAPRRARLAVESCPESLDSKPYNKLDVRSPLAAPDKFRLARARRRGLVRAMCHLAEPNFSVFGLDDGGALRAGRHRGSGRGRPPAEPPRRAGSSRPDRLDECGRRITRSCLSWLTDPRPDIRQLGGRPQ